MHNLLSISQLSGNGYDIIFTNKFREVVSQKDVSVLLSGRRKNNIYKIKFRRKKCKIPYVSE